MDRSVKTSRVRIHIGHHFFGAGNIGDDLMLAGFARASAAFRDDMLLTCCIPHEAASQIRRFPFIEWLPYNFAEREARVAQCDVWLGLGDSPFQSLGGSWFSDHLREELQWCDKYGKPMYFLCAGVNDCEALENPDIVELLERSRNIWTRDARSLRLISSASPRCCAVEASDLANIELAARTKAPLLPEAVGFILNFEQLPADFLRDFAPIARELPDKTLIWMRQEVRALHWSESTLFDLLPDWCRDRFVQRTPDYLADDLTALVDALSGAGTIVSSRYHGGLFAAWQGSRVALYCRNEKVRGLADQFDMSTFTDFSVEGIKSALASARTVSRSALLEAAAKAEDAVKQFFSAILGLGCSVAPVASHQQNQ
jgi:polysaccharide pyruvyl transferase WcaK-like protein